MLHKFSRLLRTVVVTSLLINSNAVLSADEKTNSNTIPDLGYGVALYHYYLDEHQTALTQLANIDTKHGLESRGSSSMLDKDGNTELLGLAEQANLIFNQLPNGLVKPQVLADTWFSRAKQQYLEGNWLETKQALSQVTNDLSPQYLDEFYYLNAQLALKELDFEEYVFQKSQISKHHQFHSYLEHNHLLAKITDQTLSVSDLSMKFDRSTPPLSALADRSYLAMGYAFIELGNHQSAITAFKQIAQDSYLLEPALLGYGWALNQLTQFAQAQSIFRRVTNQKQLNYFVQQAMISNAYSYERLGDLKSASSILTTGIKRFKQQQQHLTDIESQLTKGNQCYFEIIQSGNIGSCDNNVLDFIDLGLTEVLTDDQVVKKREQVSDVKNINTKLKQHLKTLQVYKELLEEKQTITNARLTISDLSALKLHVANLTEQRNIVANSIEEAKRAMNVDFFLPSQSLDHIGKINRAFKKAVQLKRMGHDAVASLRRLEMLQRTIWWNSLINFESHVNQTEQQLDQLDRHLNEVNNKYEKLAAHLTMVGNINSKLTEIKSLSQKLLQQINNSEQIIVLIEQDFDRQLRQHFSHRQQELTESIALAKLALVRMQDASYQHNQQLDPSVMGKP